MQQFGVLDDLKLSLRVDGNTDDSMIKRNLLAAESFVQHAISSQLDPGFISQNADTEALYLNAVYALAASYYTNRSSIASYVVNTVDGVTNSIIGQLRGQYDTYLERQQDEKI